MAKRKKSGKSCKYGVSTRGPTKGRCRKSKPKSAKAKAKAKAKRRRGKAYVPSRAMLNPRKPSYKPSREMLHPVDRRARTASDNKRTGVSRGHNYD